MIAWGWANDDPGAVQRPKVRSEGRERPIQRVNINFSALTPQQEDAGARNHPPLPTTTTHACRWLPDLQKGATERNQGDTEGLA